MEFRFLQMLVIILDYMMGKWLAQQFYIWMGSNLVHRGIIGISTDFCFGPFCIIESSDEDNSTSLDFIFFFFTCYIILSLICLREEPPLTTVLPELCLCLFRTNLSLSKLNCLLILFLTLIISSLSVVLGWFWLLSLILPYLH